MSERREMIAKMFDNVAKHGYKARDKKIARKIVELGESGDVLLFQAYIAGVESGKQKRNVVLRGLMLRDMEQADLGH